jgi:hypothetical protein
MVLLKTFLALIKGEALTNKYYKNYIDFQKLY